MLTMQAAFSLPSSPDDLIPITFRFCNAICQRLWGGVQTWEPTIRSWRAAHDHCVRCGAELAQVNQQPNERKAP